MNAFDLDRAALAAVGLRVDGLSKERDGCVEWIGYVAPKSTRITIMIRHQGRKVTIGVRQIQWARYRKGLPRGVLGVTCGNPACISARHLCERDKSEVVATNSVQARARQCASVTASNRRRGRGSLELAREIRAQQGTNLELAQRYGFNHRTISAIRRGKLWMDVPKWQLDTLAKAA